MTLDVRELLRRLRVGQSHRGIARDLKVARKTVARYHEIAKEHGWLEDGLPALEDLERALRGIEVATALPAPVYKAEPFRARIEALRQAGVECRAIFGRLQAEGYTGSYSALYRFVRRLEPMTAPTGFCRVETAPGAEAQVDFGYAGPMRDRTTGEVKRAWFFVMTLSFSRHQYVRFVFDQSVDTWLRCHRLAFEWFGGVPIRIKIDNLKAAIVRAVVHDPVAQRSYREFAEHYGFLISPCRPRTPEHKGKVESGVHYVKRNFLAGQEFSDLQEANERVEVWVLRTAGLRIHGTTQERPLARFEETERAALLPLSATPYDMGLWTKAKVHPDCHVSIEGAYYSAPHRLIGQSLWVRYNRREVVIYHEHQRIATHAWGPKGTRRTILSHYPPEKAAWFMQTPQWCLEKAARVGPATRELVEGLLDERPLDRLRSVQGLLRLVEEPQWPRLEAACRRALEFGDPRYVTVKRILERRLENAPTEWVGAASAPSPGAESGCGGHAFVLTPRPKMYVFARPGSEIFTGGASDHGCQTPVDPQAQVAPALGHLGDAGRA